MEKTIDKFLESDYIVYLTVFLVFVNGLLMGYAFCLYSGGKTFEIETKTKIITEEVPVYTHDESLIKKVEDLTNKLDNLEGKKEDKKWWER